MHQILVYSDSLSWGIIPGTRKRLSFEQRWPIILEKSLLTMGLPVRVIEDCLNGRRTVWEDPFKPGRNGLAGLAQRVESHSPLDLVILLLGANDLQSVHGLQSWHVAQGVVALIREVRNALIEPGMPVPPVMVIAPPPIRVAKGEMAMRFYGAGPRSQDLADMLRAECVKWECAFFDAGEVVEVSNVDGVHLDAPSHEILGLALAPVVSRMILKEDDCLELGCQTMNPKIST
jgi:lysophospholipase L1-like esterase